MKAFITSRQTITNIPSASGIDLLNNDLMVIGDDSPFLFKLNSAFEVIEKLQLYDVSAGSSSIKKSLKADLEAKSYFSMNGSHYFLIFGSGSTSIREILFLVNWTDKTIEKYSTTRLFLVLKEKHNISGTAKINLEGAAIEGDFLYLLFRGNISGLHPIVRFKLSEILEWFLLQETDIPNSVVKFYTLPTHGHISYGFSGACSLEGSRLIITATTEHTSSEIDDGEVLGSIVGIIDFEKDVPMEFAIIVLNDAPYKGKVESITIVAHSHGSIEAIAATDNDDGISEIINLKILLN